MNKIISIIIISVLVVGVGVLFFVNSKNETNQSNNSAQNVEVRDGIQYVTISARGGYSPTASSAKANIPTRLIVKTNGTYDCSAALAIRSIGYQKILPSTGEVVIDLGTPQVGTLEGLCSMGMYKFAVNFN